MKLKKLKEEYRSSYAELQDVKAEIEYCQDLVNKCRNKLISGTGSPGQFPNSLQFRIRITEWCGLEGTLKLDCIWTLS